MILELQRYVVLARYRRRSLLPAPCDAYLILFVWEATFTEKILFFRDVLFLKKLHFPRSHIPGKLHFPASLISPLSNFSRCNFSQDVNFLWKSRFFGKYNSLRSHISQDVTFSGKSLVSQSLGNII